MARYCVMKCSKQSGSTWAAWLTKYTWEMVVHIWECRNNQLHQTQRIHNLEGIVVAKKAIEQE